jgi:hypothetical protein
MSGSHERKDNSQGGSPSGKDGCQLRKNENHSKRNESQPRTPERRMLAKLDAHHERMMARMVSQL